MLILVGFLPLSFFRWRRLEDSEFSHPCALCTESINLKKELLCRNDSLSEKRSCWMGWVNLVLIRDEDDDGKLKAISLSHAS